jgi:hypothetical protein
MTGCPAAQIQAKIWNGDQKRLATECFIKGFASNEHEGPFKQIRARDSKGCVMLDRDFAPLDGSKIDEPAAKWDIALEYPLKPEPLRTRASCRADPGRENPRRQEDI